LKRFYFPATNPAMRRMSHAVEIAGYLEAVESSGQFDTTLLPVGKGLHLAVRRKPCGPACGS
jgi:predicted O-methyltransferase YrrM